MNDSSHTANTMTSTINTMEESSFSSQSTPSVSSSSSSPVFHPMVSNKNDKFISSASVIILVVFFLLLRSSAGPFLNPKGEAKKSKSSPFFTITCFLYIWITSVTVVTLIPAFSTHYNGVIAASLFFPMTFSSIAILLIGRFLIRVEFYVLLRFGMLNLVNQDKLEKNKKGGMKNSKNDVLQLHETFKRNDSSLISVKRPKMVAFHRPFRKLAKSAVFVSGVLCLLYAHCWSRTLTLFKTSSEDGAGAVCRVVFAPFVRDDEAGAGESSIWYLWSGAMLIMIISFAQDEWNGRHYQQNTNGDEHRSESWRSLHDSDEEDNDDESSIEEHNGDGLVKGGIKVWSKYLSESKIEQPKDTLEMVPWLSLFAASSVIDIFLQLMVFGGRVDARSMQSALQKSSAVRKFKTDHADGEKNVEDKLRDLREYYEGCIFDYSKEWKKDKDGGFWFDFMADCGDGFNSSYQVARMLAQPHLEFVHNGERKVLPRGQFLVNGGDLAYPNPSASNYEKRFFRTFEDAMPPPPSFRKAKIARKKPGLPVQGWADCFYKKQKKDGNMDLDIHELYRGPSSFVLPGNHDWYDGLATYTRLILCRDWLGGWLLPQQRSYFVLRLQQGWWVLGMDCALSSDIDIEQYNFFADVADNVIGPDDAVIIVNHEPHWVTDFDDGRHDDERSEQNIQELMHSHLKGKVRLRLAGDLHHYTRHIAVRKHSVPIKRRSRSRSFSHDETMCFFKNEVNKPLKLEPFTEENRPELIVSGGGGAFLHGTHQFSNNIKFGRNNIDYQRVSAFPSEKVSYLIGYMNLWHFRSRNYRVDWLMALVYFGLVSSLFPLCGLYAEYETFNPEHKVYRLVTWSIRKVGGLVWRVITVENVSLFWSCVVLMGCVGIQAVDKKIHPFLRVICGLLHGLAHITAALLCLLFVQSVAEWVVQDDIVKISVTNEHYNATNLASSLYENYKTHFFPVLQNYTHPDSSKIAKYYADSQLERSSESFMIRSTLEVLLYSWRWIYTAIPLLKTTLSIFDLPGLISKNHHEICSILCSNGLECLLTHDKYRFLDIERTAYIKYMLAISLYFLCVAIPFAGGIFGTWLAVSSNVFQSQANLSFSALMFEHYKNFVKLHINENGELEVFAVGLQKVPTKWYKDSQWDGRRSKWQKQEPTWLWDKPSKWIPQKDMKVFQPQIVDYTCITKRQISKST